MDASLKTLLNAHGAELRRAVVNHRFEMAETGLLFPEQKLLVGGMFGAAINDGVMDFGLNRIPDAALTYVLNLFLHGASQIPTFYVALFSGNVNPPANLTAANFGTTLTEFEGYDETTRQEYVEPADGATTPSISNAASLASFTINASGNVYGASLISNSTKGANTGLLGAAGRFASVKQVSAADVLKVQYTLGAQSA